MTPSSSFDIGAELAITCPQCQAEIPLSEAISHQLQDHLNQSLGKEKRLLEKRFAQQEEKLRAQQQALEQARNSLNETLQEKLSEERAKLLAQAEQRAASKLALEMKDLKSKLHEKEAKLQAAEEAELSLRKKQRQLEAEQQSLELDIARKLDEERGKIRDQAIRQAAEENQLRLADKEKLISDLKTQIENLKQKAEQGSQQMQGEVLELEFEQLLRQAFPHDEIIPTSAGARGGDLWQKIRTNLGVECGGILWETKRTRNWSASWIEKLKEDQRAKEAEFAVLLTQALPSCIQAFGHLEGIWVTNFGCALGLATALRQGLIHLSQARAAETGKKEKIEQIYDYFSSTGFRQTVEGIVESFIALQEDLETEKRAMLKTWAKRQKHIEKAIASTAALYGTMQGIVGQEMLPEIKPLQLEEPDHANGLH